MVTGHYTVSMIHKEGNDPTLCDGCDRLISLICNDPKLLTHILAHKVQKHINTLIKADQTGFIPNRQFACTVNKNCKHDKQKAFDTVKQDFLYKTISVISLEIQTHI